MTLRERYLRWRASKGYGVHSPLAFRIIGNVIRPPRDVIYYGEERLAALPASWTLIRQARILLRLVAELQPAYVWCSPKLPEIFIDAIRMAGGVVRLYDGATFPDDIDRADMVVLYKARLTKQRLAKLMKRDVTVIGFDLKPQMLNYLESAFAGGVMLDGVKSAIAVNSPKDAPHNYKISRF